jgi:hypothetical protein
MDLGKLTDTAKKVIDDRGGTDALEEDAAELREIATDEGSVTDKAKAAVEAIKDPGADGDDEGEARPLRPRAPPATAGGCERVSA